MMAMAGACPARAQLTGPVVTFGGWLQAWPRWKRERSSTMLAL
jgi:hypothetical protein